MKKIVVLMGGKSSEREVSLVSGKNVFEALKGLGKYEVFSFDPVDDNLDGMPKDVDAAYIALHGGWGESGGVQAALNELKIPYTGPGEEASKIAMDKISTKEMLKAFQVPTAEFAFLTEGEDDIDMPLPVVVKAPKEGSSVGIYKCDTKEEMREAIKKAQALDHDHLALVEAYIPGREFTVAVVDGKPWPVVEIVAKGGWYGYEEKYNSEETRYPFLEETPENMPLIEKLQKIAVEAYKAVGCRGVTRVDFRVTPEGEAYVLELNTSPGFTSHSLVPKSGMKTGLTFAEVCDTILQKADYDR